MVPNDLPGGTPLGRVFGHAAIGSPQASANLSAPFDPMMLSRLCCLCGSSGDHLSPFQTGKSSQPQLDSRSLSVAGDACAFGPALRAASHVAVNGGRSRFARWEVPDRERFHFSLSGHFDYPPTISPTSIRLRTCGTPIASPKMGRSRECWNQRRQARRPSGFLD